MIIVLAIGFPKVFFPSLATVIDMSSKCTSDMHVDNKSWQSKDPHSAELLADVVIQAKITTSDTLPRIESVVANTLESPDHGMILFHKSKTSDTWAM